MNEANEIQVSNHIHFYYFRPHSLLLSVTLERGEIFWNICASLVRHSMRSSGLLFWFNFKEILVKDLLSPKTSSTTRDYME